MNNYVTYGFKNTALSYTRTMTLTCTVTQAHHLTLGYRDTRPKLAVRPEYRDNVYVKAYIGKGEEAYRAEIEPIVRIGCCTATQCITVVIVLILQGRSIVSITVEQFNCC